MKSTIRKVGLFLSYIAIIGNPVGYGCILVSGKYLFDIDTLFSFFVYGIGLSVGVYGYMTFTQENEHVETTQKD